MIIEVKPIKDLKPAPYNPRKADEAQEQNLQASLQKFGVVEPVIWNKQTEHIVGGHFRVRELKKMGVKEVECVVVDLPLEQERELNIRLNANLGSWNMELLQSEFEKLELEDWGLKVEWPEDYSDKNEEINIDSLDDKMTIKLNYTEAEYWQVKEQLSKIAETPEQAVWKLLGNE